MGAAMPTRLPHRNAKMEVMFGRVGEVAACLAAASTLSATELAPGFEQQVLTRQAGLTAIAWGPDASIWMTVKEGQIIRRRDGVDRQVALLDVDTDGEHGALGIAVDPDFAVDGHVWLYYTTPGPPSRNRLSRFRSVGDVLAEETVLLETGELGSDIHTGGCLRFAADGTLFVSTGDDDRGAAVAQDLADLRGKILRIQRDGSPAAGNPFLDDPRADPRVWASGLRNPWKFAIQPRSGTLFIGDVGGALWEELDLGIPGANFGWDLAEGPEPAGVPGLVYPVHAYPHTSELGNSIIGGDHVRGAQFPSDYLGDYFFADSSTQEIFRMRLDDDNRPLSVDAWASDTVGPIVAIRFGPDGALYYVDLFAGLFRVTHTGRSNRQPVAAFEVAPDSGSAPLAAELDASASYDPDGSDAGLAFHWDFGDGAESDTGPVAGHSFGEGVHRVLLEVTDQGGGIAIAEGVVVSGNHRPTPEILTPAPESLYGDDLACDAPSPGARPSRPGSGPGGVRRDLHDTPSRGRGHSLRDRADRRGLRRRSRGGGTPDREPLDPDSSQVTRQEPAVSISG